MDILYERVTGRPRTYGFEYEFISERQLSLDDMKAITDFLPGCGFRKGDKNYYNSGGMYITFEPGGQIEYHSTPMLPHDRESFNKNVDIIKRTNTKIRENLGINYLATGYIPGRGDAPLLLTSKRYTDLGNRLSKSGTRGLEMMKGTASIHLHASISRLEDIPPLFLSFCALSGSDDFKMGAERRSIWNNTDPCRCGLPVIDLSDGFSPWKIIESLIRHAFDAVHLSEGVPFKDIGDRSFGSLMNHITTIFTDVRLNMNAPSFELRTLDSMPAELFIKKWYKFIEIIEKIN